MSPGETKIEANPDPYASLRAAGVAPQDGNEYYWVGARRLKKVLSNPLWSAVLINGEHVRRDNRASTTDKTKSEATYDYLFVRKSTGRNFSASNSATANAIGALLQDALDQNWSSDVWLERINAAAEIHPALRPVLDERAEQIAACKEKDVEFQEWSPRQWHQKVKAIGYAS